jgi:solute carrier family 35 protein F1/2
MSSSWHSFRDSVSNFWLPRHGSHNNNNKNKVTAIVLSQLIALLAASTNAASFTFIHHCGMTTQFTQMIPMYFLLSFQFMARDSNQQQSLRIPWWNYGFISICFDVVPNFLVLRSLSYTTLTSVTLLGALSVPSTMLFSKLLLHRTFQGHQYWGVCCCIMGGCLTVLCDQEHLGNPTVSSTADENTFVKLMGDVLVISSAIVYGLGDVVAEQAVQQLDRHEYLGMIGVFGFFQSVVAAAWWESPEIERIVMSTQPWETGWVLLWYTTSVYLYYRTYAYFLTTADATLLNLSGQASNVWAILFSVFIYRFMPSVLFFLALLLVVGGVFLYEDGSCCWLRYSTSSSPSSHPEAKPLLTTGNTVAVVMDAN